MTNRRSIADFPHNEPGLVDRFLGTTYDVVRGVYDALPIIEEVHTAIENLPTLASAAVETAMVPARLEIQAGVSAAVAAQEAAETAAATAEAVLPQVDAKLTALEDSFSGPLGSTKVGHTHGSLGAVPITVSEALGVLVTNDTHGIPNDGVQYASAAFKNAEQAAYDSEAILVLSGTYLLDADIEIRRPFICTGPVTFRAIAAGDTVPTKNVNFSRKMDVSGIIFDYVNVRFTPTDGSSQILMPAEIKRNSFINSPVYVGQQRTPTSGIRFSLNEFVWQLSRTPNAITSTNVSHLTVEDNKFQSFLNFLEVNATLSFANHGIRVKDNEAANCARGVVLRGTSLCRITKPVVEHNTISGSVRDATNIQVAAILALWCVGMEVMHNTVTHTSDSLKMQACLDSVIMHNNFESTTAPCLRASGCSGALLAYNNFRSPTFLALIGPASMNPVITNNPYTCRNWKIFDNEGLSDTQGYKIIAAEAADVRRNKFTARKATAAKGLLWFDVGCTRCVHDNNEFYAPSGTGLTNDSGSGVTPVTPSTALVVTPTPSVSVDVPIITDNDASVGGGKSYLVTFRVTHYSAIRQQANDTAAKTLTQWMSGVAGATLAWNCSAWDTTNGNKIGDIVVNGMTYDNFGPESWWWARSMMVIDRQNKLTCRNWAGAAAIDSVPPGVSDRQIAEQAWQTCTFRPPLVVDGAGYDPVPSGLVTEPGFSTQVSARTALGQKADGTYVLFCCDGQSGTSGATLPQLRAKMLALGCINAFNLDGGGSTTLWYNGAVINSPSDGAGVERAIPVCMYV